MTKNEIQGIIELINVAEEFKPIVRKVLDVVNVYKPELEELGNLFTAAIVSQKTNTFHGFVSNGFSREEAMQLTITTFRDMSFLDNAIKGMRK